MRVDRISYKKIFPIGSYINETIGVEISVDEGEDHMEALAYAKTVTEKFHKDNNPQLVDGGTVNWNRHEEPIINNFNPYAANPFKQTPPTVDYKAKERLEILIDDCKTKDELADLFPQVVEFHLQKQYETKLQSLQNK